MGRRGPALGTEPGAPPAADDRFTRPRQPKSGGDRRTGPLRSGGISRTCRQRRSARRSRAARPSLSHSARRREPCQAWRAFAVTVTWWPACVTTPFVALAACWSPDQTNVSGSPVAPSTRSLAENALPAPAASQLTWQSRAASGGLANSMSSRACSANQRPAAGSCDAALRIRRATRAAIALAVGLAGHLDPQVRVDERGARGRRGPLAEPARGRVAPVLGVRVRRRPGHPTGPPLRLVSITKCVDGTVEPSRLRVALRRAGGVQGGIGVADAPLAVVREVRRPTSRCRPSRSSTGWGSCRAPRPAL